MARLRWTSEGIVPYTAEEEAAADAYEAQEPLRKGAEIRAERNALLAQTDWTQVKDIPDAVSTLWVPYRQALRDVPEQEGFPDNVVWPTKPE